MLMSVSASPPASASSKPAAAKEIVQVDPSTKRMSTREPIIITAHAAAAHWVRLVDPGVKLATTLGVREDRVGFADFFKLFVRSALVWVVDQRLFSVGLLKSGRESAAGLNARQQTKTRRTFLISSSVASE
jgi:hypothetical protein